jgi:hypothetical protein
MAKIGFTGTRHGMSEEQIEAFKNLIKSKESDEFHHGMCVGSDKQSHEIVKEAGIKVVGHPPSFRKFMAECDCDIFMKPHDYLTRNKNIVDETDMLIATPDCKEKVRSGTWSTVRYARKKHKKIYIIHKNGRVTIE